MTAPAWTRTATNTRFGFQACSAQTAPPTPKPRWQILRSESEHLHPRGEVKLGDVEYFGASA